MNQDRDGHSTEQAGTVAADSKLRLLAEAASDLNSSLELEQVFQSIARRVYRMVESHLFCIMLWNKDAKVLEHSYSLKAGEPVQQDGGFPLGHGISGTAALLRQPVRVGDVSRDSRYVRFRHAEVDIRSELAVPLLFQNRLVGVLDLESTELDRFTEEHEQLLVALASQIATALVNARLYRELQRKEQRLARDLDTARKIQRGLLPESAPRLPGLDLGMAFAPARVLAGDFYDFLPYVDGRLALAVGDVAGKATPAALYGSLAVGIMRGHVVEHSFEPAQMLNHLNEHLCRVHAENRFLAMVFGLLDPRDRSLTLASAGFPFPRLVRAGRLETVPVAGLPLGLFAEARYEDLRLQLQPGDVVVLCSDGLEDCLYAQGDTVSVGKLDFWVRELSQRSAQEIADELIMISEPVAAGRQEATDDRTLIVIKVT